MGVLEPRLQQGKAKHSDTYSIHPASTSGRRMARIRKARQSTRYQLVDSSLGYAPVIVQMMPNHHTRATPGPASLATSSTGHGPASASSSAGRGSGQDSHAAQFSATTRTNQANTGHVHHLSQSWQGSQNSYTHAADNDASQVWIPVESKKTKKLRKLKEAVATMQHNRLAEQYRSQSQR
ncbi:hypothetical protein FA95DRAFT_1564717 [Auriscalpium vulgare]|uniref:Uncharacterized protein n=1 Tax=Auriscalpium vulgare TaxID=40419 RepID=A0ACB8REG1_9AGAM|nr:hypothetical protein FA95DRAFT_1564717 [Auriscalpium vulgare]